jgi:hypothetical protein
MDTFSPLESAVAVLYVLPLIVIAERLSGARIIWSAIGFVLLTLLSFLINHHSSHGISPLLRLIVGVAAIFVTALVLRNSYAQRRLLLGAMDSARSSENHYKALFEGSGVPLWEQDFSELQRYLAGCKKAGYPEVRSALLAQATSPTQMAKLIRTTSINLNRTGFAGGRFV